MSEKLTSKLKKFSEQYIENAEFHLPNKLELDFYQRSNINFASAMYMPHENQYLKVLELVNKDDIVIDMGSGDFRFPIMLSGKVKKVYSLELNPELVSNTLNIIKYNLPSNLIIICTDWFNFPIPTDVNTITCLCNSPIIPIEWYNYKTIIATTKEIGYLTKHKNNDEEDIKKARLYLETHLKRMVKK